jgi:hypothetical protein
VANSDDALNPFVVPLNLKQLEVPGSSLAGLVCSADASGMFPGPLVL